MVYAVGEKIFWFGERLTVTSEPFEQFGRTYQDGVNSAGKTIAISDAQTAESEARNLADFEAQMQQASGRLFL